MAVEPGNMMFFITQHIGVCRQPNVIKRYLARLGPFQWGLDFTTGTAELNWLVVWLPSLFYVPINIGNVKSSQLTNSIIFQRGGEKPPTSLGWMGWYWDKRYHFLGLVGPQWMALAVGFTSLTFVNFDPGSRVRPQQRCFFQILKVTSYWNYDDQVFIFLGWVTFW